MANKQESADKKDYKCSFKQMGGSCGEVDYDQEAFFALTDEEYKQAVAAIDAHDGLLNADLPDAMHDAIWDVAYETVESDLEEFNEDPDEEVEVEPDMIFGSVFRISYPEEVK